MVRALILAAGASSRMGRPKAALPLADRGDTFACRLVRAFLAAGVTDIVVVTGAAPEAVEHAVGSLRDRVRLVHNPDWEHGQLSSLLCGLAAPVPTGREADLEALMMTLVDVPLTTSSTLTALLRVWRQTRAPIVRPARGEMHGHPVIFDRTLFPELRAADPQYGAKAVVRRHTDEIINVPVDDDGAFIDVDTIADFQALQESYKLQSYKFQVDPT